ncbi:hypothetical protein Daus18300_002134 [Diaporthe australafricana]|uniref:protein S-acyltransferase n=1 Tax=Diaporthe australafricana TaxID=127596 RepID=A0ABR3XRQ1_9PEZI
MEEALHDIERKAAVALHTITGLKRRVSARLDAPDIHLIHDELVELSSLLEDVSHLRAKSFSGTAKQDVDIVKSIYQDICLVLKWFESVREISPLDEDASPSDPKLPSSSELVAEGWARRPIKDRINLISRHLRECRLSILSKLVILNTSKSIEVYSDEETNSHGTQQLPPFSSSLVSGEPKDDQNALGWPDEKSITHDVDNEKFLSSEMFPVFKHLRQETLQNVIPPKDSNQDSPLQSPRSPTMHQLALSDMRYVRSRDKESYFQHLDQAFSKITHSPVINERGTRPFPVQGLPKSGAGASMCSPRCRYGIGSPELLIRVCRVLPTHSIDGYYNIFGYISRKDVGKIKEAVLRKHVAVTDVLDTGMTAIGFALRHFNIEMVQFLLQEGADLFQEGPSGVAPPGFMMALEKIYTDPNIPSSDRTLLEEFLPLDTVIEMAGLSPLHKVVLGIRCLDLGELLQLDVCPVDKLDYSGRTALHWAAAKGDATAIQELLDAGAELECKTRMRSESPLMIACRTGAPAEAVRVLLAAGADVNTKDCYGQTPLCLNAGAPEGPNRIKIAAALLDAGTNVNWEEGHARATPLDFACVGNNVEMVELLIRAGADFCHHDRDGSTPLNHQGKTVLHCIAEVSNEEMMTVFATTDPSYVVDPEQKDNHGRTPLNTLDERTMPATPELREKFVALLQVFAQRFRRDLSIEEDEVDGEEFFDASDKWDDTSKPDRKI